MAIRETMEAAVLHDIGDLRLEDIPVPEPDPGEVLVRVRACGVCGTDLHIRDRGWPGAEYPFVLGHEWTGEVVELGPQTHRFAVGDRVADETHSGCGFCKNCKVGRYTACLNYGDQSMGHKHYGFTTDGGYAPYCAIAEENLHPLPESVSFEQGTLVTTAACSLYGVERADVEAGDFVVVIGPGAVGLTAVQCARLRGAGEVLVTGTRDERLQVAETVGADYTLNVSEEDPLERVRTLTDGEGADVVVETAGRHQTIAEAVEMVRKAGRVALLGNPGSGTTPIPTQQIVSGDLAIYGAKAQGRNAAQRTTRLLGQREFDADSLITHQFDLSNLEEALRTAEERLDDAIKVVVTMPDD